MDVELFYSILFITFLNEDLSMLTVIPQSIRNLATYILGKDPTINANKNDKSPSPMGTAIVAISIVTHHQRLHDSSHDKCITIDRDPSAISMDNQVIGKPMGSEMIVVGIVAE